MAASIRTHIEKHITITDEEFSVFESLLITKKLRKHQFLIQEGDAVNYEYFVLKGCLKAYETDDKGTEHIIQFAVEDWWISDFYAFFTGNTATLSIDCIEDCELVGISKSSLEDLYVKVPAFERFFRLKLIGAFLGLQKRIMHSIKKSNLERYQDFVQSYPSIEQRISNHHIASYLGIAPESLSRLRNKISGR
jgi:CRP/FNR family transcriptional regulator, anaerobic regulatory protein